MPKNILIAITGASGQVYAKEILEMLQNCNKNKTITEIDTPKSNQQSTVDNPQSTSQKKFEVHVVMTDTAKEVWKTELKTNLIPQPLIDNNSFYHPFASGSNCADVMIIVPSTMGAIGRIASGVSSDLITRAADVMLKEQKPLIIVPRETPYNLIHLRNMTTLAEAGARIVPASPEFYTQPANLKELTKNMANRILHIAGLTPLSTPRKFFTTH